MRIAIVTEVFLPKIDGITNRLDNTIRQLTAAGHEVLVIAPDTAVREHAGARVLRIASTPFPPYPGVQVCWPSPAITRYLRRFDPDVVHLVGPACLGYWGAFYSWIAGYPLVASYHTDFPRYMPIYGMGWMVPYYWTLMRWVHNTAQVNLGPSRHTRDELRARGIRNVGIWRGGVDVERFNPVHRDAAWRERLSGGRPEAPLLIYVGRVSHEKNILALEEILQAHPDVSLAIVGDGPARAELEQRFASRNVVFTGFLRGDELAAAFASADIFVQPSLTETLGFVTLEAMSSGLPVVGMRAGGITDLVEEDAQGWLVDPAEPGAFAAAVGRLLDDPARRAAFAYAAREMTETGCTWAAETAGLVERYEEAIRLKARRGFRRKHLAARQAAASGEHLERSRP